MFSMGSGFGNTGSCRRFYSCKLKNKKTEQSEQCEYSDNTNNISKTMRRICELLRVCTDLLLRKQFWMTLMMKEAASFSLKPGLNRCLEMRRETANDIQYTCLL